MKKAQFTEIHELLEAGKPEDARAAFNHLAAENTADYWLLKGKIEQKFQNWGNALNAFSRALELDENNEEARNNMHVIQNTLNFWNPEMFNP